MQIGNPEYPLQQHRPEQGLNDKELFELVRESYMKANADYVAEQIEIAKQHGAN